jgi:hypothetical protein
MITKSKQQWEAGQTVKVGFMSGLTVLAKVATPGDFAPDAYVLSRGDKFYHFVPHNGLTKIDETEARALVVEAAKQKRDAEVAALKLAQDAVRAAQVRAELLALSA